MTTDKSKLNGPDGVDHVNADDHTGSIRNSDGSYNHAFRTEAAALNAKGNHWAKEFHKHFDNGVSKDKSRELADKELSRHFYSGGFDVKDPENYKIYSSKDEADNAHAFAVAKHARHLANQDIIDTAYGRSRSKFSAVNAVNQAERDVPRAAFLHQKEPQKYKSKTDAMAARNNDIMRSFHALATAGVPHDNASHMAQSAHVASSYLYPRMKPSKTESVSGIDDDEYEPLLEADDGHWVTLHGDTMHGGVHVFLNQSGEISKGPKKLIGKKPSDLKKEKVANDKAGSVVQTGDKASTPMSGISFSSGPAETVAQPKKKESKLVPPPEKKEEPKAEEKPVEQPKPKEEPKPAPTQEKPPEAPKPKAVEKPSAPAGIPHPSELTTKSSLGGSTGAILKTDKDGNKYVEKGGASPDHVKSEYIADKIYQAAGVPVAETSLHDTPSGPKKVSKFVDGTPLGDLEGKAKEDAINDLKKNFVMDAVLANWDVVGLNQDNVLVDKSGKAHRIDNGGSLDFRAMGKMKDFGPVATEIDSMRTSPQGKPVFGSLTDGEIANQVKDVVAKKQAILDAARQSGASPGIVENLGKRIDGLAERFPSKKEEKGQKYDSEHDAAVAYGKAFDAKVKEYKDNYGSSMSQAEKYAEHHVKPHDFQFDPKGPIASEGKKFLSPGDAENELYYAINAINRFRQGKDPSYDSFSNLPDIKDKLSKHFQFTWSKDPNEVFAPADHGQWQFKKGEIRKQSVDRDGNFKDLGIKEASDVISPYHESDSHQAIKDYSGSYSSKINPKLRSGEKLDKEDQEKVDAINRGIALAGELPKPITVWRGLSDEGENFKIDKYEKMIGQTVRLDGFQSTSVDPGIAAKYSYGPKTAVLEIKTKHGIYLDDNTSIFANEKEFLMGHGWKYKVVGVERDAKMVEDGKIVNRNIIQLELL